MAERIAALERRNAELDKSMTTLTIPAGDDAANIQGGLDFKL